MNERITPAHAGKTDKLSYSKLKDRDHPRACGENFLYADTDSLHLGSPPRMRGKPKRLLVDSFGDRITPAHAGKTNSTLFLFRNT